MTEGPPPGAPPPGGAVEPTAEPAQTVVAKPGSHRAQRSPWATVVPVLVVALAVIALGVGVYGWLTASDDGQIAAPVVTPAASSPAPSQTPSATPTPSPTPTSSPTPSETPKPTPSKSPKPKPKPTKTAAPVSRDTPVVVLNQTTITGLAAQVARSLESDGWQVVGVGNWRGNVPETTVYYLPGTYAQAQQLARDVGADRLRPRVSGMRTDRLTVILNSRPS
ncbi:MAG TPA: LytR C-terminal domain-containing protein [Candidatus Limnocylindria bacterium]|nr:LytR C-terminal domain-containing protein [Candidatus Limnocylindria bacterium]